MEGVARRIKLEEQRNGHQSWVFFTFYIFFSVLIRIEHASVVNFYHMWINSYTIPVAAMVIVLTIRIFFEIGDRLAAMLRAKRVPAWLLFMITLIAYFWWSHQHI